MRNHGRFSPGPQRPDAVPGEWLSGIVAEASYALLARACGVSYQAVRKWIRGESSPTKDQVMAILDAVYGSTTGRESGVISGSGLTEDYISAGVPFGVGQYTLDSARNWPTKPKGD